ncbi:hypothetical protein JXD38_07875 [candidate division WOR-3 bacterium]|nr:hypothetical protein [candidate division WOR-3 bacterium]
MWRVVALLILPFLFACSRRFPSVVINTLWERDISYLAPVDLDGDSTDELLAAGFDHVVDRFNQDLRSVGPTQYLQKGTLQPGGNRVGGRDSAHLWLTFKRHDSLYLRALSGRTALVAVGKDSLPPVGWDGYAGALVVADIDDDTKLEAVVSVVSAMDARPRGVYVLDWHTGVLKWKYETGPAVWSVFPRDVDGDGRDELLFGSAAYGNSNVANGTTDESSYVFLLGADGRLRWRTTIGGYSSGLLAAWLDDSLRIAPRVLAWEVGNPIRGRTCDSLFILDGLTGLTSRRASFGVYTNCATLTDDPSGKIRILVAGSDKTLRLLDEELRLIREVRFASEVKQIVAAHFSHPSAYEFVVVTDDGRLKVLDHALRVMGETEIGVGGASLSLTAVRYRGRTRLLVHKALEGRSPWSLLDLSPLPLSARGIPLAEVVVLVTVLTLAFVATLLGFRFRQTRDMRAVVRGLTGQAGVVELDNRSQIRHTNSKARELLGGETLPAGLLVQAVKAALAVPPGSMPKELPVALEGGKTVLARAARVRSGVMLTLEDISAVEYLRRVKAWAPVAQKLAHGIKNPLGTIMGAVEQIEAEVSKGEGERDRGIKGSSAESDGARSQESETRTMGLAGPGTTASSDERVRKYIGYVKDEVTRLKKMTDAFMRFTKLNPPELKPRDVTELVRTVAAKYEGALAKGIKLEMSLADKLPPVALDEQGMSNVLDIVMENAVEAVAGRSRKSDAGSEKSEVADAERTLRIRTAVGPVGSRQNTGDRASDPDTGLRPGPGELGGLGGSYVRIEVEDAGAGIPEKYLDKVFDPYFTYGKPDGTGLGLALAKKIVEDHKGRMEIESVEGKRTTVTIVLPAGGRHG